MSTRSIIAYKTKEGQYRTIYCHWDGYLSYNGAMLLDHYNQYDRVSVLVGLGDISSLKEEINPEPNQEHTFEKPQQNVTVFYGRDRGEKNVGSHLHNTLQEVFDRYNQSWCEYLYVFEDGKWYVTENTNEGLKDLKTELENYYKELGIERPKEFYGYLTSKNVEDIKNGINPFA